ncbi:MULTISPECIES: metal-dependent transcriptional regulator [Actinopolyspora]|uniref:Iron (Metal) dependent repressor, DtxR family n=1 Tax=Actinopolyspora saharensis TaxID=995062 RepID=A0A1H0XYG3_9ACTN|nr:metal-dependent transcriptional regulator [Actinopolyspora saharensis]NHD17401.1 metal-dependent transcriptional regulator [Actinopolyspora sp. BKK2]NHE76866.1 metal-dependent transcriptional regulator [Actinopolyspora sp. BKK1]SDQ07726.1 iron (metal) dependent repressor, DtxR family [Actinopolyspora saharensis]
MNDLIDTTEMYLKTIYELEEEGLVPLRARIAERLEQSGPTVSQTVARMERDGLLAVAEDRHLELTKSGRARAIGVMRKHRLAERLLVDVIGLEWEHVHSEACRWEHVMSEAVEHKLINLLGGPETSPYGNPIPGLDDLGIEEAAPTVDNELQRVDEIARNGGGRALVCRIAEHVQLDPELMNSLKTAGVVPDGNIEIVSVVGGNKPIDVHGASGTTQLPPSIAHAVLVRPR